MRSLHALSCIQLLEAAESPQNLPFPLCLSNLQVQCHSQDKPLDGCKLKQLQQSHQQVQQPPPYQQRCNSSAVPAVDAAQNRAHSQASSGVAAEAVTLSPAAALSSEQATPRFSVGAAGRSRPEAQRMARMQRNRYSGRPGRLTLCNQQTSRCSKPLAMPSQNPDPLLLSKYCAGRSAPASPHAPFIRASRAAPSLPNSRSDCKAPACKRPSAVRIACPYDRDSRP